MGGLSKNPWTVILALSGAIGSFLIVKGFSVLGTIDVMVLVKNPEIARELFSTVTTTSVMVVFISTIISGTVGFFIDKSKPPKGEYKYEREQRVMHQIKRNRFFSS